MLGLLGKSFIMQHCRNVHRQEALALSYRSYMADALAELVGVSDDRWVNRVMDLIDMRLQKPQQTAGEIIQRIKNGLNGGEDT